jgi:hypothetical protein
MNTSKKFSLHALTKTVKVVLRARKTHNFLILKEGSYRRSGDVSTVLE